jgi:hypothetical protein
VTARVARVGRKSGFIAPSAVCWHSADNAGKKPPAHPPYAGWKPAETFETGIRKTVQWYLDNMGWVENVASGAYREWVGKQYGASES